MFVKRTSNCMVLGAVSTGAGAAAVAAVAAGAAAMKVIENAI